MGKYFGTDGFRGEANRELTAMHAFQLGQFLGSFYGSQARRARVVIGKDTRASGYMLEDALCAGLTSAGADAYLLHVTPTPSVSYVARTEGFDCGVMISASHNPYWDNGLKLVNAQGEKMEDAVIERAEAFLDAGASAPLATRERIGRVVDHAAGRNRYIGYLISLGLYSFRGRRIALDCANGSSWNIAKAVFDALGATTLVINAEPNGLNINRDAGSTHIGGLQKFVVENHCDVGFAFDGDADRCLCVDETGMEITGDHILFICGRHMKQTGELLGNTVVATVMSNLGLFRALDDLGIASAKTAVGDKYVYEYMTKNNCRLGGEQSGHIIFSKYASTGDGILTSLKVMEVMCAAKKTLHQLASDLTIYPQKLINVRVKDKKAAQADAKVQEAIRAAEEKLGDTGRVLVRESGTEPLVRVMVEAQDAALCAQCCEEIAQTIRAQGWAL